MGWFKKNKKILVHTIEVPICLFIDNKPDKDNTEGTLFFYLFEDAEENRSFEPLWQINSPVKEGNFTKISEYGKKVYPWLQGKNFKDIPSYWDLVKEKQKRDVKLIYERVIKYSK